jgi:hypothetical protein
MKRVARFVFFLLAVALPGLLFPTSAPAQGYFQAFGLQPWSAPIPVTGGYMDAANGNLRIEIPIASIAERGHVPFVAKLVYDSHIWSEVTNSGSTSWQPVNVVGFPTAWSGWRLVTSAGTGGGVNLPIHTASCDEKEGNLEIPLPYIWYGPFNWTAPDGHNVPFGGSTSTSNACHVASESFSGLALDASGYHISVTGLTTVVVYAPDGTQVYPNVKDTNGNYYSALNSNGDVTDTRGQMPITTTVSGSQITYAVKSSEASYNIVVNTGSIAVNTGFGASAVTEYSGNITVVNSITLPDSTTYEFGYDSGSSGAHFGTLSSMTLPTGGTVSYTSNHLFTDAYVVLPSKTGHPS